MPPTLRSEALQLGPVGLVRVAGGETFLQQLVDTLRDDGANGLNGVVSIEPLCPQPLERPANGDLVTERDLVLHDELSRCMASDVGHSHARALCTGARPRLRSLAAILVASRPSAS